LSERRPPAQPGRPAIHPSPPGRRALSKPSAASRKTGLAVSPIAPCHHPGGKIMSEQRPPLPPFTRETAIQKVRGAENAWNTCDPQRTALGYSADSQWRNRAEFIHGRAEIVAFLSRKWARELDYRLIKELWSFDGNRIAVRFAYEWHDDSGNWFRSYGNENWEYDEAGLNRQRYACINDLPITEAERKYHWDRSAPRPADHPSLSDLGL
jgi:uncharacterized protein